MFKPLTDQFGRSHTYLRVSVTDRCNLRCNYCMPVNGVPWRPRADILSFDEIERIARVMIDNGIEKIRLTGGEPMVRRSVATLVEKLAALDGLRTLAMTTNGTLLKNQAEALRSSGLTGLNVSLDTLRRDRFREITLRDEFDEVLAGIDAALDAGFAPLKLNVVVIDGLNNDEICDFVDFVRDRPIDVRFIEFMPFPGNPWRPERLVPWHRIKAKIEEKHTLIPAEMNDEVARSFRVDGFQGRVSFISPLSEHFCLNCRRLRLTADGALKSCLFFPAEVNLRDAIRNGVSDDELEQLIRSALARKSLLHPEAHLLNSLENYCMTSIGG